MSNIEKIRQEIERRRDFFYERYMQKGIGCIEETRYDECVEILSFIDSLPDCTVKTNGQGCVKDDVYDSLSEEKPSEDLEEENRKTRDAEVILNGHGLLVDVNRWTDGYKLKVIVKEE